MTRLFPSIASKLILLAVLIILSFTAITSVTGVSFYRVEALLTQVVNDEVSGVISNAQLGRQVSSLLSDIDNLSRQCSSSNLNIDEINVVSSNLGVLADHLTDPVLMDSFSGFRMSADTLLKRCVIQNQELQALRDIEQSTERNLTRLEHFIGETLIQQTLTGKTTAHLDQLMVLVAGLRESLLSLSKQLAEQILFEIEQSPKGNVISQVDDMALRLQTLTASTDDIAVVSETLNQNIVAYRNRLLSYITTHGHLNDAVSALHDAEQAVLTDMARLDADTFRRSALVRSDIEKIIQSTRAQLVVLSLGIALVTLVLVIRINRRSIQKPLDDVLQLIQAIKGGRGDASAPIRSDEWGIIQSQLLEMSDELQSSYQEVVTSRERLEIAMMGANDGLWDWNLESDEVYYSPRWKSMLGYADHELESKLDTWAHLVDQDQMETVLMKVEEYLAAPSDSAFRVEFRMRHKEGYWVEILSRAQLARDAEGRESSPRRLVGTHVDITARKLAEDVLKQSELEQRSLIAALPDIIMRFDIKGRHLFISENINVVTVLEAEQYIGKTHRELGFDEGLCQEFESSIAHTFSKAEPYETEVQMRGPAGEKVFNLKLTPDMPEDGEVRTVLAVARDITLLKKHQQQLEHIAHYDVLTGLPNRILLADRLQQAMMLSLRRGTKLGIVYIDLDGFKEVNDTYGHDVGDRLLQTVSSRMQTALRDGDTLARLGGDEFVAVIGDLQTHQSCEEILQRILHEVGRDVRGEKYVTRVGASLGVTFYPQDEDIDADQLLRQADQAMYQVKLSGKNHFHIFDMAQDRALRGSHEIIERIRTGLSRDEFELYYQPKVNMKTGAVVGVEALIRWNHPELGLMCPDDFLPAIGDHPLSIELGHWVICRALEQVANWQDEGLFLPVSVNVSATLLQHSDFVRSLKVALDAWPQVSPDQVELEILETAALDDILHTSMTLNSCLDLGVSVAIDDFGTGYSSLTYLKTLPLSTLKIDQSFVLGLIDNPDDLAILEGIMGLAKAFQLKVIAEGVESIDHGRFLMDIGCELAQGYVISRPLLANQLPQWVHHWCSPFPGCSSLCETES
ncbi:EAL domain-containing protein [Pontibacterium sp.]|uniref:EAL domain-containing protein n=1 Tax=Pontibacterium sp. TaxID=2036026 RepID=UPI0035669E1D